MKKILVGLFLIISFFLYKGYEESKSCYDTEELAFQECSKQTHGIHKSGTCKSFVSQYKVCAKSSTEFANENNFNKIIRYLGYSIFKPPETAPTPFVTTCKFDDGSSTFTLNWFKGGILIDGKYKAFSQKHYQTKDVWDDSISYYSNNEYTYKITKNSDDVMLIVEVNGRIARCTMINGDDIFIPWE